MVDELYRQRLGVTRIDEVFEINGRRARIVGFTHGSRAFTTTPYAFTTLQERPGR
jgi:putative ABC transport system permease protein